MRGEPARSSRDSTLSGEPLSESDRAQSRGGTGTAESQLNEKEKAEREKEMRRREIVAAKLTDERTNLRQTKINEILQGREQKKNTPDFMDKYFKSFSGNAFLAKNPPEAPSEEVMTRMKQRIERSGKERQGNGSSTKAFEQNDG